MRRRDTKIKTIQKILISVLSVSGIIFTLSPWMAIGDGHYNFIQIYRLLRNAGIEELVRLAGVFQGEAMPENIGFMGIALMMQAVLAGLCLAAGVIHLVLTLLGKSSKADFVMLAFSLVIVVNSVGASLPSLASDFAPAMMYTLVLPFLLFIEIIGVRVVEVLGEEKEEMEARRKKEKEERAEEKRRLRFDGKYNSLFYRIIWKNFRYNRRDYLLFLVCSSLVSGFILTGFGLYDILGFGKNISDSLFLKGGGKILLNTLIPLGMISVFVMVLLIFYYLKCRAGSYGMFLTMGMRRKTLYYMVLAEFAAVFLLSLLSGSLLGNGLLLLVCRMFADWGVNEMSLSGVGFSVYVKWIFSVLLLYIISLMLARDIFTGMRMGDSTDVREVREKMPGRFLKGCTVLGLGICIWQIYRYSRLHNFENMLILAVFAVGLLLLFRFGMAAFFAWKKKQNAYLKRLLLYHQLYHTSRTSTLYFLVMTVIQLCVLFFFSFQAVSVLVQEDEEKLYPYDVVCIADEEDTGFFDRLEETYDIELKEYPMVRVTNFDCQEQIESQEQKMIQGQHIGISETTYHALRRELSPEYEEKELHLGNREKCVYIVHQQDRSQRAQPIDFWLLSQKPFLHIGQVCPGMSYLQAVLANKEDIGWYFMNVAGEEIGSLTGCFGQGVVENVVVFSDDYFREAQELWKITDIHTGRPLADESMRIPDITIRQGPTRLVLIRADEEELGKMEKEFTEFREKHTYDEQLSVMTKSLYTKKEALQELNAERLLKLVMNGMIAAIFALSGTVLFLIRIMTEIDVKTRRAEFFRCIGMTERKRVSLLRKETFLFFQIPAIAAVLSGAGFTAAVFCARMYTAADRMRASWYLLIFWVLYLVCSGTVMWVIAIVYAKRVESRNRNQE